MKDRRPPISVYRDAEGTTTWRWSCRIPNCGAHDWRGRHRDALGEALKHLHSHGSFGFRGR